MMSNFCRGRSSSSAPLSSFTPFFPDRVPFLPPEGLCRSSESAVPLQKGAARSPRPGPTRTPCVLVRKSTRGPSALPVTLSSWLHPSGSSFFTCKMGL